MGAPEARETLSSIRGLNILRSFVVAGGGVELGLVRIDDEERLAIFAPKGVRLPFGFEGEASYHRGGKLLVGPNSSVNMNALRYELPWLLPRKLGQRTSAGFGDRLGIATPGHIRALRAAGGEIAPIFAQQSIREMERTGRSPQEVLDDATWGVFAEGWEEGFGADADHLKTTEHIDDCLAAGYTFFTFDPGEYVEDAAEDMSPSRLREALEDLPWVELECSFEDLKRRYSGVVDAEDHEIVLDELALARAAIKYGRAVAHVARLYRHLEEAAGGEFEVEVSVDETTTPTTPVQHFYIASELRRLSVEWVSLAPRYVGTFEKGVDYIGDVEEFELDLAVHASLARELGPYKLSLHSGSDKFLIYPAAMRQTRGLVHLKTAGTSYLEALRTVAALDPGFFREAYALARKRYREDRASYHVSAELGNAPLPEDVSDEELTGLLEQFDAREIMHVTFGSVLGNGRLRERLLGLLRTRPEHYATNLEAHFLRHLEPFSG